MIWFVPDPVTCPLVTSIDSIVESSDVFLIRIFPVSTSTASEKVNVIFLLTTTLLALSTGEELINVGAVSLTSWIYIVMDWSDILFDESFALTVTA